MYKSVLNIRITSLYGSQPSSVVFACKTAWLASESLVCMGPSPHIWFLDAKQRLLDRNNKAQWFPDITRRCVHAKQCDLHQNDMFVCVPALICDFCMQNSPFRTRISSLYGSQTTSVVLSTHNIVLSTRITSLYGSQPSSVVFACKTSIFALEWQVYMSSSPHLSLCASNTVTFGLESQISMGPRPHLFFCACKTAWFAPEYQVCMGSNPQLWFCPCKTATLGPDLQVCMGPSLHLWFWAHITTCLAQE